MASEPSTNDWERTKQRLMTRWPALTADELDRTDGKPEALTALLQGRLGYAPANAQRDLDEILRGRTIVPRDVADEQTHTGTSGPVPGVQPPSGLTSFPGRAPEPSTAAGMGSAHEPVEATSGPAGTAGGGRVRDYPLDREPGAPPREHTDDSQHGPTLGHPAPAPEASRDEAAHRQRDFQDRAMGMTAMLPMRGMAVALVLIAITAAMVIQRRRASRRRGLIARLERQMPAAILAKGARRWAQAAPHEVMHAAERLRDAA
ncbi:MAG: hypothetical protein WC211_05860 [Dehalococcoidia bacterium]